MIAYGVIKANDVVNVKYLIVYQGDDETIGYDYMQIKKEMESRAYLTSNLTFDYQVLSKSHSINAIDIPDYDYLKVLPVEGNQLV